MGPKRGRPDRRPGSRASDGIERVSAPNTLHHAASAYGVVPNTTTDGEPDLRARSVIRDGAGAPRVAVQVLFVLAPRRYEFGHLQVRALLPTGVELIGNPTRESRNVAGRLHPSQ